MEYYRELYLSEIKMRSKNFCETVLLKLPNELKNKINDNIFVYECIGEDYFLHVDGEKINISSYLK
jgi:hypothetical protein